MPLNTYTKDDYTSQHTNASSAAAVGDGNILDVSEGSIALAFADADASVALYLQAQIVALAALTRFNTRFGSDADAWGADFGYTRLLGETDAAYHARYPVWLAGLTKATPASIDAAISGVQAGIIWSKQDNVDAAGNFLPGNIVITIDDGTGTPPANLLTLVYAAVLLAVGEAISFNVIAPTIEIANVSYVAAIASNGSISNTQTLTDAAVTQYVNSLTIGTKLAVTRIAGIVYDATPYVTDVTSVTINGAINTDFLVTKSQVIKLGTLVSSVTY